MSTAMTGARLLVSPDRPSPLVVTAGPALIDDIARLAAVARAEPIVAEDGAHARSGWAAAPLVIVGADALASVTAARLPRRPGVVLVVHDRADRSAYEAAVAVGAEKVIALPDDEAWLVRRLGDAAEPAVPPAAVIAVVGGRGGAGATTMAVALAVTSRRLGHRTLLVDADPLGGGIDLALGGEQVAGLRWPGLGAPSGRMNPTVLRDALPTVHDLAVLSWDRSDAFRPPGGDVMRTVLDAGCRGGGLVVVDLPRHLDEATRAVLERTDLTLLVVPAEVRATAAAIRLAAALGSVATDVGVVVRGPSPAGLTARAVADCLGLPLLGELRSEPRLAAALERGDPPGSRARAPLAQLCSTLLASRLAGPVAVTRQRAAA